MKKMDLISINRHLILGKISVEDFDYLAKIAQDDPSLTILSPFC